MHGIKHVVLTKFFAAKRNRMITNMATDANQGRFHHNELLFLQNKPAVEIPVPLGKLRMINSLVAESLYHDSYFSLDERKKLKSWLSSALKQTDDANKTGIRKQHMAKSQTKSSARVAAGNL